MVKNPTEWSAVPAFQRHQRHNFLSNDEVRDKSRIDSHEETVWSTALPHVKMTSMDFINIRNDSTRKYYTCRILVPLSNCWPELPPHFNFLTNTKIFLVDPRPLLCKIIKHNSIEIKVSLERPVVNPHNLPFLAKNVMYYIIKKGIIIND